MATAARASLPLPLAAFPSLRARTAAACVWQQEDSAGGGGQSIQVRFMWILAKQEAVSVNQCDCSLPRANLRSLFFLCAKQL